METDSDTPARADGKRLFGLLIGVYFGGGLLNAVVSLLVPRLRIMLGLDYAQASCIQLAYYSSYLVFALPIALATARIGYMRAIAAGLMIVAIGCLAFAAAQTLHDFAPVLLALLIMSSGVTFLQIAGNAVITAFGSSSEMAPRFTLLQAFNSLGTVIGPLVGAWFLLGRGAERGGFASSPAIPFLLCAAGFLLLASRFFRHRALLAPPVRSGPPWARLAMLLRSMRMRAGIATIFAYVGAEVTIGTLAVSYLMLPATIGASPLSAGRLVSLYWAGAMLGRLVGAFAIRRFGAARLLSAAACAAATLLAVAILVGGAVGAVALLAIGLFHSVMFPLAYALALPEDDADAPLAAMLLCMAVVGGAVVPVMTGVVADVIGLVPSLVVPGLCYAVILGFGLYRDPDRERRVRRTGSASPSR